MNKLHMEQGQAALELAQALLKEWGVKPYAHFGLKIQTDSGTLLWLGDGVRLGKGFRNWPSDWLTLKGTGGYLDLTFTSVEGSIERAERILAALAGFLASKDFLAKKKGSIRRLKAITKALQG